MQPLYDSYAVTTRPDNVTDPRCNPIIADVEMLPEKVLMVVPPVDILVHEQLTFAERVKADIEKLRKQGKGLGRSIETIVQEGCFHGWLELPEWIIRRVIGRETRREVFERCAEVVREVHEKNGFVLGSEKDGTQGR